MNGLDEPDASALQSPLQEIQECGKLRKHNGLDAGRLVARPREVSTRMNWPWSKLLPMLLSLAKHTADCPLRSSSKMASILVLLCQASISKRRTMLVFDRFFFTSSELVEPQMARVKEHPTTTTGSCLGMGRIRCNNNRHTYRSTAGCVKSMLRVRKHTGHAGGCPSGTEAKYMLISSRQNTCLHSEAMGSSAIS